MVKHPELQIVFSRLFFPQPLNHNQIAALLARLASETRDQVVIFETRANTSGIVHLVGCDVTYIHELRGLLRDLVPGTLMAGLDGYKRASMLTTGTVRFSPAELPLSASTPEQTVRAIYSALARPFKDDETVAVQVTLGPGISPRQVPAKIPHPAGTSLWAAITKGVTEAPTEIRTKVRDRAREYAIDCLIRIGVNADTDRKRRSIGLSVLAGMRLTADAGVRVELRRDAPTSFNLPGRPRWYTSRLTISELVPLLSLPLGAEPLPGMPPAHPKLLRAESAVPDGPLVVAQSLIPGDNRLLGTTLEAGFTHYFAIGPTGVGKTTLLERVMLACIKAGCGVLIVDPKDQTPASLLPRIPRERWKDIYEINAAHERPNGINIVNPGNSDPDVYADSILVVFEKLFGDVGPRTSDILNATFRTLVRTFDAEDPHTILDLPRLLTDAAFRRKLATQIQHDPTLAGYWAWYDSMKPTQQMSVIAPTMNRLRKILLRPQLVKILGQKKPAFHLPDLFTAGKIVLLPLNEALIGSGSADLLGALVTAIAWNATQARAAIPAKSRKPGFVFIDEADRFMNGTLTVSLADALARSRSLEVGWALSVQLWDQLPKPMKSAIKTNARTKVVFRLEDEDDARTFARLAPELEPLDFMSLQKYEVYVRLVVDGVTTGWALAKTLPLDPPVATLEAVRREARRHHPTTAVASEDLSELDDTTDATPTALSTQAAPATPIGAVGRKRRHQA